MSSKRDYVVISQIIKDELDQHGQPAHMGIDAHDAAHEAVTGVALSLATHFEERNPAFDRERFLTACGVSE